MSLSHIIQLKEIDLTKARMLIIRLFIRFIFLFKAAPSENNAKQNENEEETEHKLGEEEQQHVEYEELEEEEVEEEDEEGAGEEEGNFKFL